MARLNNQRFLQILDENGQPIVFQRTRTRTATITESRVTRPASPQSSLNTTVAVDQVNLMYLTEQAQTTSSQVSVPPTCPVCFLVYSTSGKHRAIVLSCGHITCLGCLYHQIQLQRTPSNILICSICRSTVTSARKVFL